MPCGGPVIINHSGCIPYLVLVFFSKDEIMNKIWFDITNTPQVHFLGAIYEELKKNKKYEFSFSLRDFSETKKLFESRLGQPYKTIGTHYGKSKIKKTYGLVKRFSKTLLSEIHFDISLSCGSEAAVWSSFLKRKKSIAFGDNDLARQWTYGRFVDYAFFPDAIPSEKLTRQGISKKRLFLYPGYKEDIYLANYSPDETFLNMLPFNNYVIVRPENIQANYIGNNKQSSITPALLKALSEKGFNILYLPRYKSDHEFAAGIKNIFIPETPLNGLDACYYSDAVLTGAGTFAREAACMGIPSFSFFAGKQMLAVDIKLQKEGLMYYSRNPIDLITRVLSSAKKEPDLTRSQITRDVFMQKLTEVLDNEF